MFARLSITLAANETKNKNLPPTMDHETGEANPWAFIRPANWGLKSKLS